MRSTHTVLPPFFHPLNFTAYACGLEKPTLRPEWAHLGEQTMAKTLLVTLELPVRAMTEEEWNEAWDDCGHDASEDEGPDREGTLQEVSAAELGEAISGALNSANSTELLAGSGLFVHTDDALILSVGWKS